MKAKSVVFLISLIVCIIFSAASCQQETPPVTMQKITGDLYEILGGRGSRGGAYIADDCVLVIDAKMDKASVDQVFAELGKITDKPVKYLVNTHSDGDHIYGNRYFPETVMFVAHENCREEFFHVGSDGSPSDWYESELAPFIPSVTFKKKMDLFLGSKKVELWYFGVGHTTGDAVVYFPAEKTAFVGDQIFTGRPQLIHSYKGGNSFEYVKTMTKMLETLDAERFCSGHSDVLSRIEVWDHINGVRKLQEKVSSLVSGGRSLEEALQAFNDDEARLVTSIYNEIKNR